MIKATETTHSCFGWRPLRIWMSVVLCLLTAVPALGAAAVAAFGDARLLVYPPRLTLSSADDHQRLLVVHRDATGVLTDVSAEAEIALADSDIVAVQQGVHSGLRARVRERALAW